MSGHPPLYPLPLREGTLTLDTLQLAAGWFINKNPYWEEEFKLKDWLGFKRPYDGR